MNINNIRKEFPIFDEKIQNNDLVYLDSANSSQKRKVVLDRKNDFYSNQFSNVGRNFNHRARTSLKLCPMAFFKKIQKYKNKVCRDK